MHAALRIRKSDWRVLAVLLLALLLRLGIPAGYMLGSEGSALALIPCPQVVTASPAGHGQEHHPAGEAPSPQSKAPCPYVALASPILPPPPPILAPPPELSSRAQASLPPELRAAPPLAAPPPPSRGPPSLA